MLSKENLTLRLAFVLLGLAWPLSPAEGKRAAAQLRADPSYRVLYEDAQVLLLARRFAPVDSAATWQP